MRLRWKEQGAAVYGRDNSGNGVGSQQRQVRGQATVAEGEAAKGQTTINQKAVAIAAELVLMAPRQWQRQWRRRQWGRQRVSHGRGDGGANMAPTVAEGGRPMWAEVIFPITYYYLRDSACRCDNNCQAYGKTQMCFDSKHKCVSICKTHLCFDWQNTFLFCKTHLCFQSVGPVCRIHLRKDTNYLKNEIGFSNIGDFKKIWNRAKTICCPPPFPPPIQCLPEVNSCALFCLYYYSPSGPQKKVETKARQSIC